MKALRALLAVPILALTLAAQSPVAPPSLERGENDAITAALPDDPQLAKAIAPLAAEIHASFDRVLAQAPDGIARRAGAGKLPLGFLVADIMRDAAAAVVGPEVRLAVTNSGGLRRDLPAGPVRVEDIYEVLPFDNELVVADYSGAELAEVVREGLQRKGGEPIAGLRVEATGTLDDLHLGLYLLDGQPVLPTATYRVATSDYLLANGDYTPTMKRGRNPVLTSIPVRQALLDWCRRQGQEGRPLQGRMDARYRLAPELAPAVQALAQR